MTKCSTSCSAERALNPRKLVVDLRSRTPAFRMPDDVAAELVAATPPGWTTEVVEADTESSGDGSQRPSDESLRAIADAEIYLGFGLPKALWQRRRNSYDGCTRLRPASRRCSIPKMLASDVALTNSAGIYGEPIAEHVLAGVLYFLRAFDVAGALQRRAEWNSADLRNGGGAGSRGERVPRAGGRRRWNRQRGGAQVLGAGRDGHRASAATRRRGLPPGFRRVAGPDGLDAELSLRRRAGAGRPAHAGDANAAHGRSSRPAAARRDRLQRRARRADRRAGARRGALAPAGCGAPRSTSFQREPLAADSPLWHLPHVLHTPHVAGVSPRLFWDRLSALFLDNFTRYRAGRPAAQSRGQEGRILTWKKSSRRRLTAGQATCTSRRATCSARASTASSCRSPSRR